MAVEKQMTPSNIEIDDSESVEVEVINPDAVSISGDDESMVIDFSGEMVDQIMALLEKHRVPCGRVNTARDIVKDPHVRAREMLVDMAYPGVGTVPLPGIPVKLSETPGKIETRAPGLGEHNEVVYSQLLDLTGQELESMKNAGII